MFSPWLTCSCPHRSRKLIQESEQHLKDVEKILQNDKRYLVLECVPEERRKLIMFYIEDLDRRGPPPPPTASEPTRRSTKWPITSSSRPEPYSSFPSARAWPSLKLLNPASQFYGQPRSVMIAEGSRCLKMYHRDEQWRSLCYVSPALNEIAGNRLPELKVTLDPSPLTDHVEGEGRRRGCSSSSFSGVR